MMEKWDPDFIRDQDPSIEFLELYALTCAITTWGERFRELQNRRITIFCDNEAVVFMVNSLALTCVQCRKLIRILALDGMRWNRRLFVKHVRTESNELADSLSRQNLRRFWKHAPNSMNKMPDSIVGGLWPPQNVWFNDDTYLCFR